MTTFLSENSSPHLPAPSAYTAYLERQVAIHAAFVKRRRKERVMRRLKWAAVASVGVLVGVATWRAWL